jgi:hypothetical protein
VFTSISQSNLPYRKNSLPKFPVDHICEFFKNATGVIELKAEQMERKADTHKERYDSKHNVDQSEIEHARHSGMGGNTFDRRATEEREEREEARQNQQRMQQRFTQHRQRVHMYAFRQALDMMYNRTGEMTCFDLNGFDQFYKTLPSMQRGPWTYQRCSELVFPFEVPKNSMFLSCGEFEKNCWNPEDYAGWCDSLFHNRGYVNMRLSPLVVKYGIGRDIDTTATSKIAFINAELDPWSAGGVLSTLSDKSELIAIRMSNGVHTQDMMTPRNDDSRSVNRARDIVMDLTEHWMKQYAARSHDYVKQMGWNKIDN